MDKVRSVLNGPKCGIGPQSSVLADYVSRWYINAASALFSDTTVTETRFYPQHLLITDWGFVAMVSYRSLWLLALAPRKSKPVPLRQF